MKDNIRKALGNLQRSGKTTGGVTFTYSAKNQKKSVKAKIGFDHDNKLEIKIAEINGYQPAYIRSRLTGLFAEIKTELLPHPGEGDEIWTREPTGGAEPGDQVSLNASIYYYAVNGGIMDCNGRQLGQSYQATLIKLRNAACSPGGAIITYTIFQL